MSERLMWRNASGRRPERTIRCYRACGFVEGGREHESVRIGEHWHDDIIMGLLEQDYHAGAR